eukprot:950487-Heterocapsa_arctica.AAC.1
MYAHSPVRLRLGGNLSKYMRHRVKRHMAFQGLTRKEARTIYAPEGDYATIEGTLDEDWIRLNKASDNYLCQLEDLLGQDYK